MKQPGHHLRLRSLHRGFTLVESLMAAGVLLIIVTAVGLAVSAGQQHAYWAQQRISGTLAAEELLCRLQAVDYDDLQDVWDEHREEVGEMVDMNGSPLPASFSGVGREVFVSNEFRLSPVVPVEIFGVNVRVLAFDAWERPLAELRCFVPKPLE